MLSLWLDRTGWPLSVDKNEANTARCPKKKTKHALIKEIKSEEIQTLNDTDMIIVTVHTYPAEYMIWC